MKLSDFLLRAYPASWRAEYGDEFRDVLARTGVTPVVVLDVLCSAVKEHFHRDAPWKLVAFPATLALSGMLISSIVAPVPYEERFTVGYAAAVLFGTGFWTTLRGGARPARSALYANLVMMIPAMLAAVLLAGGVLGQVVLGPGDEPTTWAEHGFAMATYSAARQPLRAHVLFLLPLYTAPSALLWGWIGGATGRWMRRRLVG